MYASNSAAQVSTILNVGAMPASRRAERTRASVVPQSSARRRSAKPICLARRRTWGSPVPARAMTGSKRTISRMFSRNQGSMADSAVISAVLMPRRYPSATAKQRSGVGMRIFWRSSSRSATGLSSVSPQRSCSSERTAFCSASLKVRPMAMTSPTDFIWVVRVGSASGNFSKAQRGNLTTQ